MAFGRKRANNALGPARRTRKQEAWMPGKSSHERGLELFHEGHYNAALREFECALGLEETSELWNDWAALQLQFNRPAEAEEGFRRSLEIDPKNAQVAASLGTLLFKLKRYCEAQAFLEACLAGLKQGQKPSVLSSLQQIRAKQVACPQVKSSELGAYLRRFAGSEENSQSYFNTHLGRYLATLDLLPDASPGQRLLELGTAFHHLTPALVRWKGYRDIRCSDLWEGGAQCERRVVSSDSDEEFHFTVDNFDVQSSPWPYPDVTFDVVLCCEMLEHLVFDPMQVLAEINRILKTGGRLLLTTPNIASAKGVDSIMRGESPYVYGKYEPGGLATDRHNREYTPGEVALLLGAAGFDLETLRTRNSWWTNRGRALRHLVAAGFSIGWRGDNILCLARKAGRVRDRYPEVFYSFVGTQFQRRAETGEPSLRSGSPTPIRGQSRVLIIHEALPRPDQNGCDVRLMQVLNELLAQGHKLTFVALHGVGRERYTLPLQKLGIKVHSHDAERLRRFGVDASSAWTLEAVLKEGRFDLAILFLWFWDGLSVPEQYLDDIRRFSPHTRVAILTDDQHGLREHRLAELTGLWTDRERAHDFKQREFEIYGRADMVLAISEADRQGLQAAAPGLEIEVLPMVAEGTPSVTEFAARANVLFLGNFQNVTSLDGLKWLVEEVWPRIAGSLPDVELHLAGHHLPEGLAGERVVPLGYVKDLDAVFAQHRVFVSPVRFCTGIQTKVLGAVARGLPVVTTPTAAEGLNLQDEKQALFAATAEDFARQIKRLYCDEHLWRKLSQDGADLVKSQFSRERLAAQVRRVTDRVLELKPKPYDARHVWPVLRIEKEFPEILTGPAPERLPSRIRAYCTLAELLLGEGNPTTALEQLRHVLSFMQGGRRRDPLFARILLDLDRCYRKLGSSEPPTDFVREARECLASGLSSPPSTRGGEGLVDSGGHHPSPPSSRRRRKGRVRTQPDLSVIIPTYNRYAVLASCLAALEQQSLAKDRFEVIVVDDGSTDGTERLCQGLSMSFRLVYLRQVNAGAGAARKLGTEAARGEYLLLFNDDTIATPDLLGEHLRVQREHGNDKCAVLGHFHYPCQASKRALSSFFATRPFLFPQAFLQPGFYRESAYFIGCNLSIRREAVLGAGSFDPQFRVAEDTELGVRLEQQGYRILYQPQALAWHDHLIFTAADLIERARVYAPADILLFKKHPRLLASGRSPFGKFDADWAAKTKVSLDQSRRQVTEWTQAIARFDHLDFAPLFNQRNGEVTEAELVLKAFDQVVPQVYWFHLFERLLELQEKVNCPSSLSPQLSALGSQPSVISA
jgi:GT2 family glycosyltransferase/tetratricopeptide (TPR) repeat protein/glycosyltransferase involved in cell wall biosynthesis